MRTRLITILALCAAGAAVTAGQVRNAFAPDGTPISLGLAGYAKVLCSAVFVSSRKLS